MTHVVRCVPLVVGLVAALAAGCAGRVPAARQEFVDARPELSDERRVQILSGEVVTGMTEDEVLATLGEPMHRRELDDGGKPVAVWTYPGALVFRSSALATQEDQDFMAALIFADGVLREIEKR